jgi:hypothetical protein
MQIPKSFYRDFVGIGVELTGERGNRSADIERTLLAATRYIDSSERRLLGLLCSWIIVHANLVCIGKLKRIMQKENLGDPQIVSALAFLAVENKHHEWKSLCKKYPPRYLWGAEGTKLALKFQKPVDSFAKAGLLLSEKALRIDQRHILPIMTLAKIHLQVRLRLLFGANIRADAAFYISKGVSGASDLMRAIGCSYEPAHRILEDFNKAGSLDLSSGILRLA